MKIKQINNKKIEKKIKHKNMKIIKNLKKI
jgi:hypothetical protein